MRGRPHGPEKRRHHAGKARQLHLRRARTRRVAGDPRRVAAAAARNRGEPHDHHADPVRHARFQRAVTFGFRRSIDLDRFFTRLRGLAVAAGLGLGLAGCGYNAIPTQEQAAKAAWSQVQNEYQRRADLIPNLVSTVQGYAKQEKDVLTAVTEARAKATQIHVDAADLTDPAKVKQFQDAQAALSGALGRLLAVSENYPDLKSNANFLALQSQLEGTENRIAVARKDYIAAVRDYNTTLVTMPGVIWASTVFRSKQPMAEFTADQGSAAAPKVKF
ncbi:MAG: LemA family protein [Hyphomicrobiales bacterium]|nr:LemA family protein [Hyphomicrobiales bacterium]MDE2016879.1 LemA family protein [Hyphomicrobiales bacterium]